MSIRFLVLKIRGWSCRILRREGLWVEQVLGTNSRNLVWGMLIVRRLNEGVEEVRGCIILEFVGGV